MFKRAVSLVTVCALLVSCTIHDSVSTSPDAAARRGGEFGIRSLLTRSGERLYFAKRAVGRSSQGRLVINQVATDVAIAEADVETSMPGGAANTRFRLRNGREYVGKVRSNKDGRITVRATTVIVPISDVELVTVQKVDKGKTFLVTLGMVAGAALGVFAIILATKESCPFIYSFDGSTYMLDGEPYGGATAPGLKRTDWGRLKYLQEVAGEYRLKVANEVDETQYTDELKLLVVDHPPDVTVVVDEGGSPHSVVAPAAPVKAEDARGRDILPYVKDDDWISWQSLARTGEPDLSSGTKEKLVFEFPKPAAARRVKLVFDGGNTLWASQMVKRFLALRGRTLPGYYASLSTLGPELLALHAWNLREELYRMNIRVSTTNGWVSKGSVMGGGPFVSRPRLYVLDVADVPGEMLEIEMTPAVGFWTINHLAVDYSGDVALQARELAASRAVDWRGTDIRPLLASTDDRFFAMPHTGDTADVVFEAPPPVAGLARSVLLKTNGYYDIHMGALGEPKLDVLARVRAEPGYSVRYAWDEFRRWQAEQTGAAR